MPVSDKAGISRRNILALLAISATAWGLGIPGAAKAADQPAAADKAVTPPPVLRIGYQKSAVNLVLLKQQKALEKRFPGTKVSWIEFPAGPQLLEALSVGSLDFGLTGDSPPVFAQAAGKDLYYVGAEPPKPASSAILVLKDSDLQGLEALKGRKIALQKGSSSHYLLVQAVRKAGLKWSDITPVYLSPADARAAFERKSVDAWAIWDPYYAAIELQVPVRVLTTGTALSDNSSFYLASRNLVEQYPDTIASLFSELSRANDFALENRTQAIELIAGFSGLDPAVVELVLRRRESSPVAPLTEAALAEQQRVADAFLELNLIPRRIKVTDIVWHPAS